MPQRFNHRDLATGVKKSDLARIQTARISGVNNMAKTNLKTKETEIEEQPTNVSGARLKSFISRVEKLEEEKKAISEDIRDVYAEAKGLGFEPKIVRKIVSLRKTNLEKRREEQELLDLYMSAIGMAE
jgi:uncharacterized protein (UPF0335 family)